MTTELAVRHDVTPDGEIVERRAPMTLFGTDNPEAVVERASAVATALASVIKERHLSSRISGKEHVNVEGWTLLGSMLGVFAEVEWSRPLDNGWEARAVARTLDGRIVGAAEAMCTTNEYRWGKADPYAVRSMAQTRAVSKALRMPLGFIMHLAGYSATPVEEMADEQPEPGERTAQAGGRGRTQSATTPAPAQYRRDELLSLMREHDLSLDALERYAAVVGIPKGTRATNEQMDALIEAVRGHGTDAPIEPAVARAADEAVPPAAEADAASEASVPTPSDAPPPKPGTPEYKALPSGVERSRAKAYWDAHPEEEPTLAEQLQVIA